MLRLTLTLSLLALLGSIFAQTPREELPPIATEVWEPIPPKVKPGTYPAPPADAIVLFEGDDLDQWVSSKEAGAPAPWTIEDGAFTVEPGTGGIQTKMGFGSMQLHIEWRSPIEEGRSGQGLGNSGIFLMSQYELQVLNSYESQTYANGQASSIYKQHAPLVNACLPANEWQTYDVIFTAPTFYDNGRLKTPAYITVLHNGILTQNHVALWGPTQFKGLPVYEAHADALPISLQDHSNKVSYRNIWVRPLGQ